MQVGSEQKSKKNIRLESESGFILFNLEVLNFLQLQSAHTIFMVPSQHVMFKYIFWT